MKNFIFGFIIGAIVTLFGAGIYVRVKLNELRADLIELEQSFNEVTSGIEGLDKFKRD
jgi:hypothetical protein